MQTDTQAVAYFGKIPVHGDFVRRNANGAAVRAMDAWVQEGLYYAKTRLRAPAESDYADAGASAFFYHDGSSGPLLGVLHPSWDRVGRAYPFVVLAEAGGPLTRPADVPVQYSDFFDRAAAVARAAAAGSFAPPDLAAQADRIGAPLSRGDASFARFLQETPLPKFWERLWGHADDTRKYLLFKNLIDIVPPLRGRLPKSYPLVLRFPLGTDGRCPGFDAKFWLETVRRLLGATDVQPSFFWSLDGSATRRPFLLLTLRPPPPALFAFLFFADPASDALCMLENLGHQNAAIAALSIPAYYGRLLEDEHLTLGGFLNRL